VSFPATDPGHYAGTMTWTNDGGVAVNGQLSVPIEAFVTAGHVAVYEPSRILLPDGHAVMSRDTSKVTMLGWLGSGTTRYDVALAVAVESYDPATGHLAGTGSYQSGSLRQTAITLSLQRTNDPEAPTCPASGSCAMGNYCDGAMNRCLPGSGPMSGAGIVSAAGATPSTTLASSLVTAWNGPLAALSGNSLLSGSTPRQQFERPYCFQTASQAGPAAFARGGALLTPSDDLACNVGGVDVPQVTFGLMNSQQEVGRDGNGATFNRLNDCVADLDVQPTSSVPGSSKCASVPRFLLALRPGQSDDVGYRMKTHLLRQWLGVNAYVANSTVQNQQYEDVLGVTGQPPQTRLAQALDRHERGLGVLLDPSARPYYAPDAGVATDVARAPDYRFRPRPVARWTFNTSSTSVPNAEAPTDGMALTCRWPPWESEIQVQSMFGYVCAGSVSGVARPAGSHNTFTIVAADLRISILDMANIVLLSQDNGLTVYENNDWPNVLAARITLVDQHGNSVWFPPLEWNSTQTGFGMVAIVGAAGTYSLLQALPGQAIRVVAPTAVLGGGADLAPSSSLSVGAIFPRDAEFGATLNIDELSLWDRALSVDDFAVLAARYNFTPSNDSLPPVPPLPLSGDEQAAGLPVHMLEAADADLKLVQAYLAAESNPIYSQCLGGQRDELALVLGRVGKSLRLVSVIGDEAASVVAATGTSTPWYPRYQADRAELAGRRADVISKLAALQGSDCKNPLGISEGDLPLYVGSTGASSAERFFSGSRFLANAALSEITVAGGETGSDGLLSQARSAYNAARSSQFQEDQGAHDSADRILKLSADYEAQLKRYCGAPPGEDVAHGVFPLLRGFQNGTFTAANCFLKTEVPACAALGNAAVSAIPSQCLRGEMGERLLAIQTAAVDAVNADHAFDRAMDQFNSDMGYCGRLKIQLDGDQELLRTHLAHMWNLTLEKEGITTNIFKRISSIAASGIRNFPFGFAEGVAFKLSIDRQIIQ
jgi:hypothetical protein